jgi:UDP:flavonoid glycosyltransferase YjiC (YdhE family)
MRPLIRAATNSGHEVVVATGPDLSANLKQLGVPGWIVGPTMREAWADLAAAPLAADEAGRHRALVCALFARPGVRRVRAVLPQARRWSPDLVIHDLTDPAGPEVAALLGVPTLVHGTSPYAARQIVELTQVCAEFAAALMLPDRYADIVHAPFLDPYPASLQPAGPRPFSDVRRIRPEVPPAAPGERLPLRMQRFPYERTVLLTLGAGQTRPDALLVALQVLRDFPVNVVVETGPGVEVAQVGRQPSHVAVAQQLPLAQVLASCTAVISPGSAEQVLGALAYGLPQVCLPRTLDQRHLTAAVTATGAGIAVAPDPLIPGVLRRAVADVLAVPAYARAARDHQASIATMPAADDVLRHLTPALAA